MNAIDAQDFIQNVVKELWPDWTPTDYLTKLWNESLANCDFEDSKRALRVWYAESVRPGKDPVLGIFNKIKVKTDGTVRVCSNPLRLFGLSRIDRLDRVRGFYVSSEKKRPENLEIEQMAEQARRKSELLYGGQWVVIRDWEGKEQELDDGLRGRPAREKAEELVLAGSDSPGRRFLIGLGRPLRDADLCPVMKTVDDDNIPF